MKEKKERSLGSLLLEFSFWFKQNLEMKGLQNKHSIPVYELNIHFQYSYNNSAAPQSGLSVRDL